VVRYSSMMYSGEHKSAPSPSPPPPLWTAVEPIVFRSNLRVYNQDSGGRAKHSYQSRSDLNLVNISNFDHVMPGRMDGLLDAVRGLPRDSGTRILILVRSARDADVAACFLSGEGYPTTAMHGDRPHWLREEAFNDFKSGRFPIITSTEVKQLAEATTIAHHIINFQLMNRIIGTGSGQMFRIHQDPDPKHILFSLLDLYRVYFNF